MRTSCIRPYISGDDALPPLALTTRLTALQDAAKATAAVAAVDGNLIVDYDGSDNLSRTR